MNIFDIKCSFYQWHLLVTCCNNVFCIVTTPPPTPIGKGYVFILVCLFVCLFVCLPVSLSVSNITGKKHSGIFMKFSGLLGIARARYKEQCATLWERCIKPFGYKIFSIIFQKNTCLLATLRRNRSMDFVKPLGLVGYHIRNIWNILGMLFHAWQDCFTVHQLSGAKSDSSAISLPQQTIWTRERTSFKSLKSDINWDNRIWNDT